MERVLERVKGDPLPDVCMCTFGKFWSSSCCLSCLRLPTRLAAPLAYPDTQTHRHTDTDTDTCTRAHGGSGAAAAAAQQQLD